jgi:DNA-binding MarR family transcriptional regulator
VSLANFLGSTSEIRIIDFLAENMDMAYNQTELRKCLGMSRTIINQKIPILIYNNIIEVKECKGNTKKYGLKKNSLVNKLISIIYEHSFMMAEYEEEEEESLSRISEKCQTLYEEEVDCYCGETHHMKFYKEPIPKFEYNKVETKWVNDQATLTSA